MKFTTSEPKPITSPAASIPGQTGKSDGRKCVVQEQVYGKECRFNKDCVSGCTLHHVTPSVDKGRIVLQRQCRVDSSWTKQKLKDEIQRLESDVILDFIKTHQSSDKMGIAQNKNLYPQVAIHVRRGDYVKLKSYGLLSKDYYQKA